MIKFKKVRFKNFGSFGNNYTEIQLDRHQRTLISGFNGHGKSFALLDSITFALFGNPFRKINIPQLVSYISQYMTLLPGDIISTGTPFGVGLGFNPPKYLKPGDVVELGIDKLGTSKQIAKAYSK